MSKIHTCCSGRNVLISPAHRLPEPKQIVLPVPEAVRSMSGPVTEAAMGNIFFHVDDDIRPNIRRLRGRM